MRASRIKIILIVLFLISCIVTVLLSPYFILKNITLNDDAAQMTNKLKASDIVIGNNLNLLLLYRGNIISGHLVKIEEELSKDVSIKNVSIKRTGKNDIHISYTVRKPIMCIEYEDYMVYFDYDGTIIDTSYLKAEKSILVKGVNLEFFYVGCNILTCNYMLDDVALLCQEIEKYDISNYTSIRALINEIEIRDSGNIVIRYDNRVEILLNMTNNVKYNANVMCSILSNMNQSVKGYIDFTIAQTPYFTPSS